MVTIDEEDYLEHVGTPRHSGRYPWGSGGQWVNLPNNTPFPIKDSLPRSATFLDYVDNLRAQGLKDTEIAKGMKISTTQLRAKRTIALNERKQARIVMAERLREKGYSYNAIAQRMQLAGESSVRALLAPGAKDKQNILIETSDMLKSEVDEKKFIDVGTGVEHHLGISTEKLNAAVSILREKGYHTYTVDIPQPSGFQTKTKVLVPPGISRSETWQNRDNIRLINRFSQDGGRSFSKVHEPIAVDPNRVVVRYKEDGGDKADGVIYVREGVPDLSLGGSRYAQVRIKVGDDHYLKGMAMYSHDLPDGADLVFNTGKSSTGNKLDAMKPISKEDPDLPFGTVLRRQITEHTGTPEERITSAMNIVNEEGNWGDWSKSLSSQFLSKQSPSLATAQLAKTYDRRKREFDEIMELTNPTVKKKLLEDYANETDHSAVHLEAAALHSRQRWHVILPVESMPPTQVYAPNYDNGDKVVVIRFPHAGTFEIPELIVNNKHPEAKNLLGNAPDAIGIHPSVAKQLSGADFDGDTVLVIPQRRGKEVTTTSALSRLQNFDPQVEYKKYDGMVPITKRAKEIEMGKISNLITDMTVKGASTEEIVRAVRHSMVIIDSEKHELNWKQSAIDHNIAQLKQQYQGKANAGAATLLSRSTAKERVPERKPRLQPEGGPIDLATGRRVYVETGRKRRNAKTGELVPVQVKIRRGYLVDNPYNGLVSEVASPMEKVYADHSNRLRALANQARLAAHDTPSLKISPSATKTYAKEVASLNSKLIVSKKNAPLERQALILTHTIIKAKRAANPNIEDDTLKRLTYKTLTDMRNRVGMEKELREITITPQEWDAIQAGAISNSKLSQILMKANMDVVRKYATPKPKLLMTTTNTQRARAMLKSGATRAEVARQLGVSLTTLDTALKA